MMGMPGMNARVLEQAHRLIGPRPISDEIPQVICTGHRGPSRYVRQHRLERGDVGMDVGYERVAHVCTYAAGRAQAG